MSSDPRTIERALHRLGVALEREVSDRLPRKVGVQAVQLFRQSFRDGGFRDGVLRPWQKSRRELSGGRNASSRYKTLTSARNHLMNSIASHPGRGQVSIENPVPYASLHNEGGTIATSPTITPQMRRFAWAMYYKTAGRNKKKRKRGDIPEEAKKWIGLALTKKTKLHIRAKMPQRQFIGESRELREMIQTEIQASIKRIQKHGISTQ